MQALESRQLPANDTHACDQVLLSSCTVAKLYRSRDKHRVDETLAKHAKHTFPDLPATLGADPSLVLLLLEAPTMLTSTALAKAFPELRSPACAARICIPQADPAHYALMVAESRMLVNVRFQRLDAWLAANAGAGLRVPIFFADYETSVYGRFSMRLSPLKDLQRFLRHGFASDTCLLGLTLSYRLPHKLHYPSDAPVLTEDDVAGFVEHEAACVGMTSRVLECFRYGLVFSLFRLERRGLSTVDSVPAPTAARVPDAPAAEPGPFEDLLSVGPGRGYLQLVFGCPPRPGWVPSLPAYIEYLERCRERWPDVAAAEGGPEFPAAALRAASAASGGTAAELSEFLRATGRRIVASIASSRLCESLMMLDGLWDVGLLQGVLGAAQAPPPLLSSSAFAAYRWPVEYHGRAFLSVGLHEADLTALALMSRLVDPALYAKIGQGWGSFLQSLLGAEATAIEGARPFRQVLLGTLEREWFRLRGSAGDKPALPTAGGFYRKRVIAARQAVQKAVRRWSVGVLCRALGLRLFAFPDAEHAVLLLPDTCQSAAAADEMLASCRGALEDALPDGYDFLSSRLRLEAFRAIDISFTMDAHGYPQATVLLSRRSDADVVARLKCVGGTSVDDEVLTALTQALADARRLNAETWAEWMS